MKVKVCLVGDSAVGKTSLVRRFVHDEFDDHYASTMGAKVSKKEIVVKNGNGNRVDVDMTIWDIMGEESFRDLLKEVYFHGVKGILTVCDLTRRETLFSLVGWVNAVRKVTGDIPLYILANKVDLKGRTSFDEVDLRAFAGEYGAPYAFTSAKTGENVQEAFQRLAVAIAG
ncbi:MAG: Rab family GTPase [Candidatus Methylomirabilales bacterium]